MTQDTFSTTLVAWTAQRKALMDVRDAVFIHEQGVPLCPEWDGRDAAATHALARSPAGEPIGVARLLDDGQLGRMAVMPAWRRQGVGSALLAQMLRHAQAHALLDRLFIHAQCAVEPFYRRHGFRPEGERFAEAGIPHIRMRYAPAGDADDREAGDV